MQTRLVFLVMDFGLSKNDLPRMYGTFGDYSSALSHVNEIRRQYGDDLKLDIIPAYMMIGNAKTTECASIDFRKHLAFDLAKMEKPARCDMCKQNASYFCYLHDGIYCNDHITDHEDTLGGRKEKKEFGK